MRAGPEIGPTDPTGRSSGRDHTPFNGFARGDRNVTFAVCQPWCGRLLTRGASNMTEALANDILQFDIEQGVAVVDAAE
jgi:hypothetical protein